MEDSGAKDDKSQGGKTGKKTAKSEKWKFYKTESGKVTRTRKYCPRCGPGIYLAEHSDRFSCGKCSYTEFKGQPSKNQ